MDRIEVRYKPVAAQPVWHKYIVYIEDVGPNEQVWYARGGPGGSGGGWFGTIDTVWGEYAQGTLDWDNGDPHPAELIAEAADLSAAWDTIKATMDDIDTDYLYVPSAQNSNTAVDVALAEAGLPAPTLDGFLGYPSPGSSQPLYILPGASPISPDWGLAGRVPYENAPAMASPLVLDLDGDGVELTSFTATATATFFDIDNDGFAEQSAWITANQDGLLARDLNSNGKIDSASELFGSATVDGFAILQELDDNGDHRIDQYDTAWSTLRVWRDTDGDAVTDSGELLTLASLNIVSFDLAGITASTSTVAGNPISHTSSYKLSNGTTRTVADAWFTHDNMNTVSTGTYTLDARTEFLPTCGDLAS